MSLLLEALKKAELAKQSASAAAIDAPVEPVITRDTLPDISSALQIEPPDLPPASVSPQSSGAFEAPAPVVDLQVNQPEPLQAKVEAAPLRSAAVAADGASPRGPGARMEGSMEADRAAARQMFEAKEVDYNPKRPFYITLGVLGLCAAGYGGYLWWQLQPRSVYNAAALKKPAPDGAAPSAAPAPAPPAAAASDSPVTAQPSAPAPSAQTAQATGPTASTGKADSGAGPDKQPDGGKQAAGNRAGVSAASKSAAPGAIAAQQSATPATRPRPVAPARGTDQRTGSAIAVTPAAPAVDQQIERAYEAFHKGDLAASRSLYQASLQRDPGNRDALLGLAAIDMRMHNFDLAEARYLKLLESDPRDAHAAAGLIALRGQTDPVQSESRLKTLIAQQPDAAHLHFALGNQLAAQSRWPEAQQSYFKAFSLDSENPDFAFNLAVSLDHLRQGKLALEYYRRSISLSSTRAASFDRGRVNNRIAELTR